MNRACAVCMMILLFAGCDLFGEDDGRRLTGTTWRLAAFLTHDDFPPSSRAGYCTLRGVDCVGDERSYTVTFWTDGSVRAQADCNTCGGSYERDGAALRVESLVCTESYCGPDSRGSDFAGALGQAEGFSLRDDWLLIAYDGGRGLLLRATSSRRVPSPRSR